MSQEILKIGPVITGAEFPREFWGQFHNPKTILQTKPIPAELTYVDLLWGDHVNNGDAPRTRKATVRGWVGCYASLNGHEYRNYKWDGDALMLSWNTNTNNEQIIVFFSDDPCFSNLQVIPCIKDMDDPYTYTESQNMVVECNFHCLGPDSAAIGRKAIIDVLRYAEAFVKHESTRNAFGKFDCMLAWAEYFKSDDELRYIARALEEAGYPMPWDMNVSPAIGE